jgi:plasmid stabilization system protein ParE
MVKVEWTKQAIEDIFSIREYYLPLSPKFANKVTDQIFSKERLIASFPTVGRVVPELNNENVREIIYKQFRIIYVVLEKDSIHIITVHTSSKPLSEISLFG